MSTYIRYGYCRQCGRCCYLKNLISADTLSAFSSLVRSKIGSAVDAVRCIHLDPLTMKCSIFESPSRPLACWIHPNHPNAMVKGCSGYTFVEISPQQVPPGYVRLRVKGDIVYLHEDSINQIARVFARSREAV